MLLLSNGRVLTGPISEDVSNYVIKQGANDLRFPKRDVQGAFSSLEDAYRYKLAQVPDRDPDEQLKLARWCMSMKLMPEARTALEAVLALSPNHARGQVDARPSPGRRGSGRPARSGGPAIRRRRSPRATSPCISTPP